MPGPIDEALGAKTPLGSDLAAGVDNLSLDQEIWFTSYVRLVLPMDGYVFWVRSAIVGPSALPNAVLPNRVRPGQPPQFISMSEKLRAKGSIHYATDLRQEAGEFYAAERVVFTSEQPVNDLSAVAPGTLWIGEFQGKRFAFSSRASFYRQADLYHYVGFAVYPDMETQIIDTAAGFDSKSVVVSNSLPAWLSLNGYVPAVGFGNPSLVLYPSFLSPQNMPPPFGTVDIPPELTHALALAPTIGKRHASHTQLCKDTVRITLWGTRNFSAVDFVDCVYQWTLDRGLVGLMNSPVPRDEKRTQAELGTIAMKKTVEIEVSYLQHRMRDLAVQTIQRAVPSITISAAA